MHHLSKIIFFAALVGCDAGEISPRQECASAETYAAAYGTPESPGPCIGRTLSRTVAPGQVLLGFEHRATGGIGMVHWSGGRIVSVSLASG